jgi:hypothetical protein
MDKLTWLKSTHSSGNGECVECAHTPDGGMAVRDSKDTTGPALSFPREGWRSFLREVRQETLSR